MKANVFFSSTAAILFSSILFLTGCGASSTASNSAPPVPPAGGSSAHGTFVYVRNFYDSGTSANGSISAFRMNPDGTLTALQGSPFPINGNLAVSGNFLLVADYTGVMSYRIDPSSGSLTPAAHTAAGSGVFDPIAADSKHLYRSSGGLIYGFSINDDGTFAAIPGSPFVFGTSLLVDDIGIQQRRSRAEDSMLFVSGGIPFKFSEVSFYNIQNDGSLDDGQSLSTDAEWSLAVHPSGRIVYAVNGVTIDSFTIDANGMLSQGSSTPDNSPNIFGAVAMDRTGKFLAAIDTTPQGITDSHISVFSIDPITSSLTELVAPVSIGVPLGRSITFDPSGRFILITDGNGAGFPNDVMVFSFDSASGTVTKIQAAPTGIFPVGIVIATF